MTVYYVDATLGSDSYSGLTPAAAWQTAAKVNTVFNSYGIAAGDTILFKAGETFAASGGMGIKVQRVSGTTAASRVTLDAYGTGDLPTIDGEDAVSGPCIGGHYVSDPEDAVSHVTVRNMRFIGSTAQQGHVYGADDWIFQYCIFGNELGGNNNSNAFMLHDCDDILVEHCGVYNKGASGSAIYIGDSGGSTYENRVTFRHCWVETSDAAGECIDWKQNPTFIVCEHCTFIGGPSDGSLSVRGTDHTIENCLIINTSKPGIVTYVNAERITMRGNIIMTDQYGIELSGTETDFYIYDNVIEGQARGVHVGNSVDGVEIYRNRFHNCVAALWIECAWADLESDNNIYNNCTEYRYGGVAKTLADLQAEGKDLISKETNFELFPGAMSAGAIDVARSLSGYPPARWQVQ